MVESPFDILGVPFDADDAAVRRAYAKKVRQHPPETDPAGFQRVCDAFESIRDAEARTRWRQALESGETMAVEAHPTHVHDFIAAANGQIHRLASLASDDLLETEAALDEIEWTTAPSPG